jgi:hypothetical protein
LDLTGQSGLSGDVGDGTWDAELAANQAPVWTANERSPLTGRYTMVLPADSYGDSYGTGAVKNGVLTLAGKLTDGSTFSASAPVALNGQWPFYTYVASSKDSVLGWVTVGDNLAGTNITWSKPSGKGPVYAAGFTNGFQMVASPWVPPAKNTAALSLANPVVTLSGGGLAEPLTVNVGLQNFLTYSATNLSLTISASTGSFSGWFDSPGTGRKQAVSGVVLQNSGSALGSFQGANESGTVLLQENQ